MGLGSTARACARVVVAREDAQRRRPWRPGVSGLANIVVGIGVGGDRAWVDSVADRVFAVRFLIVRILLLFGAVV